MNEKTNWHKKYEDVYLQGLGVLDEHAAHSLWDKDFYLAAAYAKRAAKSDGFYPSPGQYGEPVYSARQGIMASCHTREEVAAILAIQKVMLRRLTFLAVVGVACLAVLLYVASRLHG